MNWQLPVNYNIAKGDLAGIMKGYFLLAKKKPLKPIVTSNILQFLFDAVHKVTVFHTDTTFERYVADWLNSYGANPNDFVDYIYQNKAAIMVAIGDYMVVQDLIAQYAKLKQIKDKYSLSISGFIDYLGNVAAKATDSVTGTIGDVLGNTLKNIGKPVITFVIIALVILVVFGMIKNKYYSK